MAQSASPTPLSPWLRDTELHRAHIAISDGSSLRDGISACGGAPRVLCLAEGGESALLGEELLDGATEWRKSVGAVHTPLRFRDVDTLIVKLDRDGEVRAVLFPPEDLPHLAVYPRAEGALRSFSTISDASRDPLPLLEHAGLAHCTRHVASLSSREAVFIPAGWFYQLSSRGASVSLVERRFPAARGARLRPSLMHLRAAPSAGPLAFLGKRKARSREGVGGVTPPERCGWLREGWSTNVSLTSDWFSHNIAAWCEVLARKRWLRPAACCLSTGGRDSAGGGGGGRDSEGDVGWGRGSVGDVGGGRGSEGDVRGGRADEGDVIDALEVGSWEGNSMAWMAAHLSVGRIVCVDHFEGGEEHAALDMPAVEQRFDANAALVKAETAAGGRAVEIVKVRARSREALPILAATGQRFDLVYIDGSHRSSDVLLDAAMAWATLKEGGLLCFDDASWHAQACPHFAQDAAEGGHGFAQVWGGARAEGCSCPGRAIDAFLSAMQDEVVVVRRETQVWVEKRSGDST